MGMICSSDWNSGCIVGGSLANFRAHATSPCYCYHGASLRCQPDDSLVLQKERLAVGMGYDIHLEHHHFFWRVLCVCAHRKAFSILQQTPVYTERHLYTRVGLLCGLQSIPHASPEVRQDSLRAECNQEAGEHTKYGIWAISSGGVTHMKYEHVKQLKSVNSPSSSAQAVHSTPTTLISDWTMVGEDTVQGLTRTFNRH